jgi:putative intracellular protease/amidase
MVALIDHLVQQEMLERRPHPSDRRARLLYLTGHGREVLSKAASFSAEWENYIQAGLWRGFAVRDGNLITGQQNFSGGEFARWSSTRSDDNSRWGVGGRW